MDGNSTHVIVIGGGIGGLCLAQGLRKAGVSVEVYEREAGQHGELGLRGELHRSLRQQLPILVPCGLVRPDDHIAAIAAMGAARAQDLYRQVVGQRQAGADR